jgi:hypothetical protein
MLPGRWRIFTWRGVGVIHGEIVRPRTRAERMRGFERTTVEATARDELNDLGVHEKISQSTMRISPLTASAIRQAVAMRVFFLAGGCFEKTRQSQASYAGSFGARTLSLSGGVRGRGRRVRAHRQTEDFTDPSIRRLSIRTVRDGLAMARPARVLAPPRDEVLMVRSRVACAASRTMKL